MLALARVETRAHLADAAASIAVVARVSRAYTPPLHCIRSNAIVNVSRGYAAITSCRKEQRTRPDSTRRNSGAAHSAMDFARRARVVCARGGKLLRCTVNRQSNQGLAVASPRAGGVRSNRPEEMDRGRFQSTRRVLLASHRTAIVACACALGVAH